MKKILGFLGGRWLPAAILIACSALYAVGFDMIPHGRYAMDMVDIALDASEISGETWR